MVESRISECSVLLTFVKTVTSMPGAVIECDQIYVHSQDAVHQITSTSLSWLMSTTLLTQESHFGALSLEEGKRPPTPQDFSLTKKTARFTKGQIRPYEGPKTALLQTFLW